MGAAKNIWALANAEDGANGNDDTEQIPYSSFVVDTSLPLPLMIPRVMFVRFLFPISFRSICTFVPFEFGFV